MSYDGGRGHPKIEDPERDIPALLEELTGPEQPVVGTSDIAEAFDITRQSLLPHLHELDGKDIGSVSIGRTIAWFPLEDVEVPETDSSDDDGPPGATVAVETDGGRVERAAETAHSAFIRVLYVTVPLLVVAPLLILGLESRGLTLWSDLVLRYSIVPTVISVMAYVLLPLPRKVVAVLDRIRPSAVDRLAGAAESSEGTLP